MTTRVLWTGVDDIGRSAVSADGIADAEVIGDPPLIGVTPLLSGDAPATVTQPGEPVRFFPPAGGVRSAILEWAPRTNRPLPADYATRRKQVLLGYDEDTHVDGQGLHASRTLDVCFVISGEITLELADGSETPLYAGDVVVQNATAHRWSNRGDAPCRMLVTMFGL